VLQDLTESTDRRVKVLIRELEKELPAAYEATIEHEKDTNEYRVKVHGTFSYMIPAEGLEHPTMAANIAGRTLRELVKGAKK
jgi:hypothetical protein